VGVSPSVTNRRAKEIGEAHPSPFILVLGELGKEGIEILGPHVVESRARRHKRLVVVQRMGRRRPGAEALRPVDQSGRIEDQVERAALGGDGKSSVGENGVEEERSDAKQSATKRESQRAPRKRLKREDSQLTYRLALHRDDLEYRHTRAA